MQFHQPTAEWGFRLIQRQRGIWGRSSASSAGVIEFFNSCGWLTHRILALIVSGLRLSQQVYVLVTGERRGPAVETLGQERAAPEGLAPRLEGRGTVSQRRIGTRPGLWSKLSPERAVQDCGQEGVEFGLRLGS
jgi:hypothetical protein